MMYMLRAGADPHLAVLGFLINVSDHFATCPMLKRMTSSSMACHSGSHGYELQMLAALHSCSAVQLRGAGNGHTMRALLVPLADLQHTVDALARDCAESLSELQTQTR